MPTKKIRGKGEGAIYKDARGYWTASVELPPRDGKRRRRTVRAKDKATVQRELRELQARLHANGDLPSADQTVATWFDYWYKNIAQPDVRPKTAEGYRTITYTYVIPIIGHVRLSKVSATKVREVTDYMVKEKGLSPTYALGAHRVISIALNAAVREGRIPMNPAQLMKAPRKDVAKLDVLSLDEGVKALEHFKDDETYGARWAAAMLTGARRGEILGLEADRVGESLDLSWQLQRALFEHGCKTKDDGTHSCKWKRSSDCPERKIVAPADYEYRMVSKGLYLTRPKSRAGWREIPLVDPLRAILETHMRLNPPVNGLVFTRNGAPVDPAVDSALWVETRNAIFPGRDVRLHDLRHGTADLLYLAGIPEDLIVEILGHSTRAMSRQYKSRGNDLRMREAMASMSALFTRPAAGHSDTSAVSA